MLPIQRVAVGLAALIALYLAASWWTSIAVEHHGTGKPEPHKGDGRVGDAIFRRRLVAVGDLHGDLLHAQKILQLANVLSPALTWSGDDAILVQTGDIVDRGTYAWDIYKLMARLRGEAGSAGGRVVSILGNHEVMNAIGDWRYVTQDDIKHTGGSEQRLQDMSQQGWLGQEWLANYSTTARVSIHPSPNTPSYSFTHGSLRPSFPHLLPYPERINQLGHTLLSRALTPPLALPYPPNPYKGLPAGVSRAEEELYESGGPFWWRGLAEQKDEKVVCKWAGQLQKSLNVRRIIGGHTPNFERIVDRCNASIIIIDTGMSSAYGGVLSALEITYSLHPLEPASGRRPGGHPQEPFIGEASLTISEEGETSQNEIAGLAALAEPRIGETYWEREEVVAVYEKGRQRITLREGEVTL